MSVFNGEKLKIEIYGSSHGPCVGVKMEGLPKGTKIDTQKLQEFLDRRAPGTAFGSTSRKEPDKVKFVSGLSNEIVDGPLVAEIENVDVKSQDYEALKDIPRPGHSDYAQYLKTGQILPGGGEFGGRMTASLCIAGGILKSLLEEKGIRIKAEIFEIAGEIIEGKMQEKIGEAIEQGDSVGGIVSCIVDGLKPGIGGPTFERFETGIARVLFSIPSVKGVEFGEGFGVAALLGSENNDPFIMREGKVQTAGNNHGGVLGGVTSGMPLIVRVAIKPTPSISKPQRSVNLKTGQEVEIEVNGRHDACIVPRVLPCVEAALAIAIYDRI